MKLASALVKLRLFTARALPCLWLLLCAWIKVDAGEIIYVPKPESAQDKRNEYADKLLALVIQRTASQYGTAEIRHTPTFMTRNRVLAELKRGELLQVADAPTRPDFERDTLPIRIPLRKGILGYRLFLIDGNNQSLFDHVTKLEELKRLRAGSGSQWSITPILQQQGFTVTPGLEYQSLFQMLKSAQMDYFPRGISEIFTEYQDQKANMSSLHIEDKLALYVPLPTYFFVTPKRPILAKRISDGLEAMIKDGSFDHFFMQEYGEAIRDSKLGDRKIFVINNAQLSPQTPLDRKELWYTPH